VFNPLRIYHAELRALLVGDESLVAAELCQQAFGSDRQLERTPADLERAFRLPPAPIREQAVAALQSEPEPAKGWEKALERVLDALTGDLIKVDVDFDKVIGGVSAAGSAGSCASRLVAALESTYSSTYCVVTDRRLIFAEQAKSLDSFTELVSLPRGAVLGARRRGRFLQRGRVVLEFVDLSQLALMPGILVTRAANRLITAINRG